MSAYVSGDLQSPSYWTLAYARVELGSSLAILDENIGAFHSARGSLDFGGDISVRKRRLRETGEEAQFTDARLGRGISSNIDCVDSGADDIVLRLQIRAMISIRSIVGCPRTPSSTGEYPTYNGARSDSNDSGSSVDDVRADSSRSYRAQTFRNLNCIPAGLNGNHTKSGAQMGKLRTILKLLAIIIEGRDITVVSVNCQSRIPKKAQKTNRSGTFQNRADRFLTGSDKPRP